MFGSVARESGADNDTLSFRMQHVAVQQRTGAQLVEQKCHDLANQM